MKKIKKIAVVVLSLILLNINNIQAYSLQSNNDSNENNIVDNEEVSSMNLLTGQESNWTLKNNRAYIQNTLSYEGTDTITPKKIVGDSDDRYQITNTTTFPYSAIVSLDIKFPDASCTGTGFMIGANTVATAGHCLYDSNHGGWATSITVVPGRNKSSKPFGTAYATTLNSVKGWTVNGNSNYDYGVIELNTSIGDKSGWFGLAGRDSSIKDSAVSLVGYPGDKTSYTLWKDTGKISTDAGKQVRYAIDTFDGQSGAPVYWYNSTYGYQAAAIHTGGYNSQVNRGTKVTMDVFNFLTSF